MRYAEARPNIRSGDLLAWGHNGWKTVHDWQVQAVRFFTKSEYAHVGVAWVIAERVFVIEAVVPQVRIFPLSKRIPCHWFSGEPRLAWSDEIESVALSIVGEPYSKWEAIQAFFGQMRLGGAWQCAKAAAFIRNRLFLSDPRWTPTALVEDALERGARHNLLVA